MKVKVMWETTSLGGSCQRTIALTLANFPALLGIGVKLSRTCYLASCSNIPSRDSLFRLLFWVPGPISLSLRLRALRGSPKGGWRRLISFILRKVLSITTPNPKKDWIEQDLFPIGGLRMGMYMDCKKV